VPSRRNLRTDDATDHCVPPVVVTAGAIGRRVAFLRSTAPPGCEFPLRVIRLQPARADDQGETCGPTCREHLHSRPEGRPMDPERDTEGPVIRSQQDLR
jgi:hypothetical protein